MSTLKIDLDYNCSKYIKSKIALLEVIYKELLRQEKELEEEDEKLRNGCRILRREKAKESKEAELDSEPETAIPEPEPESVKSVKSKEPVKIKCECGIFVVKKNLKRHMTSKSHINNLKK